MALIAAHRNAGHSGGDNVAIGIYSPSSPHLHTPLPPFCPSLISLMVSVDVKHHVYLLTYVKPWPSFDTQCQRGSGANTRRKADLDKNKKQNKQKNEKRRKRVMRQ